MMNSDIGDISAGVSHREREKSVENRYDIGEKAADFFGVNGALLSNIIILYSIINLFVETYYYILNYYYSFIFIVIIMFRFNLF